MGKIYAKYQQNTPLRTRATLVRCTFFALIVLPKLIHAAARIACDSGPTCSSKFSHMLKPVTVHLAVESLFVKTCITGGFRYTV